MGRLIEQIARAKGHEIVCIIDKDDADRFASENFMKADVAIEFSTPKTAVDNIRHCFAAGVPVVSGTTGWQSGLPAIRALCERGEGSLLYSSNFSIGVNVFEAISRRLALIMNRFGDYTPSMTEIHHIHKLDHPSGTAVTLAEDIVERVERLKGWEEPEEGKELSDGMLPVGHIRRGEEPGTHVVSWDSPVDTITIEHKAKSREGFARGAVAAAEWLAARERKDFYSITDMLGDLTGAPSLFE